MTPAGTPRSPVLKQNRKWYRKIKTGTTKLIVVPEHDSRDEDVQGNWLNGGVILGVLIFCC
jgi:hypothetical protein